MDKRPHGGSARAAGPRAGHNSAPKPNMAVRRAATDRAHRLPAAGSSPSARGRLRALPQASGSPATPCRARVVLQPGLRSAPVRGNTLARKPSTPAARWRTRPCETRSWSRPAGHTRCRRDYPRRETCRPRPPQSPLCPIARPFRSRGTRARCRRNSRGGRHSGLQSDCGRRSRSSPPARRHAPGTAGEWPMAALLPCLSNRTSWMGRRLGASRRRGCSPRRRANAAFGLP